MSEMAVKYSQNQSEAIVEEWQAQLRDLLNQVEGWAKSRGWRVARRESPIQEEGLPPYTTESLDIHISGEKRVYLEPIARLTLNGRGVAELYGWPSIRRVRLQPERTATGEPSWVVMTDSGIPLHQEWNLENFAILVNDLVA